jgi:HTH-type transcriptional regulator / antitoxin MqsA
MMATKAKLKSVCGSCGALAAVADVRDMSYAYKGEPTVFPKIKGEYCHACGEVTLDAAESRRVSQLMKEFNAQVNAAMVDPAFIVKVRKKLSLDQRQAAQMFGGGVNAFSRYENGKTKPPLALVKLLKVLDKHPELLAEIA